MGYGDIEGLEAIKRLADENLLELRQQAGVRIGLLIVDDKTLIYAPTPRLIDAGSTVETKPNAIMLGEALPDLEKACGSAKDSLPSNAEIGRQVVQTTMLKAV